MADKMVVMKNWLEEAYEGLSKEEFNELCGQIIRYGLLDEYEKSNNFSINMVFSLIMPQIDKMQNFYEEKVAQGSKGGRPPVVDNQEIWRLAQTLTGAEIIEKTGIKKSTLYNCEGWKERKNAEYFYQKGF